MSTKYFSKNNRILITGGAGFLGTDLIKLLLRKKYTVLLLDKFIFRNEQYFARVDNLKIKCVDVASSDNVKKIIKDFSPDLVIHAAALHYIPECEKKKYRTLKTNVLGTQNIIDSMKRYVPNSKIIFISSASVYGRSKYKLSEKSFADPITFYGKSKLWGESLVSNSGLSFKIIRLFNLYGPGDKNLHIIPIILKQAKEKGTVKIGNMNTKRDFIHVVDANRGILAIINKGRCNQIYNLGSGKAYSIKELTVLVCNEYLKIKNKRISFVSQKKLFRKNDIESILSSNRKVIAHTGWKPEIDFRDGIRDIIQNE